MNTRLFLSLIAATSLPLGAADWPQFRGPDSSGTVAGAQIPAKPKIDWTAPLPGRGLASPIVVGERVFVTCSSGPSQERLHVICFSANDGSRIWERQLQATGRTMAHPKTSVAACTPCSDGRSVFAIWSSNDMAAFDLDGGLLWLRGLTADYPNASNSLGMASSPIVVGGTVVTLIENDSESYTLGIDAKTGRNLWKLERPKAANWTSPVPWKTDAASPAVAVLQSSKGLLGVNAETGSTLWEYKEGASTTSSSVVSGGVIYAPSNGITAIVPKANGEEPEQLWRSRQINPSTISPVVLGGMIFSINGVGVIATADIKTGDNKWKLRLTGPFSGSPVGSGSHLVAVSEKGLLQIIDTAVEGGAIKGTLQLPLGKEPEELVLSTPALSGGKIFIRADSALWRVGNEAD